MQPAVFDHPAFPEYELIDSGEAEKLERFAALVLRRPDPQALWKRSLPAAEWEQADLVFVRESDRGGRWEGRGARSWEIGYGGGRFLLKATPFKHVGLFPEQASNWELVKRLASAFEGRPRLLNLFGYTGIASVLARQAGYHVTHVDASKSSVAWTRENAELSGLVQDGLRMLVDDALAFARREVRRGERYEVILVDPPHYGRGPKGEKWQFETGIATLCEALTELLAERSLLCLSTYAIGTSPLALHNLVAELGGDRIECGELALPDRAGRLLPAGFCARSLRGV